MRLFNIYTSKDYKSAERDANRSRVNGKILDKNNIFMSLAKKGRRGRLEHHLTASQSVAATPKDLVVNDYASVVDQLRSSPSNSNIKLGKILLSQTKSPSMASLHSSASQTSRKNSKNKLELTV